MPSVEPTKKQIAIMEFFWRCGLPVPSPENAFAALVELVKQEIIKECQR